MKNKETCSIVGGGAKEGSHGNSVDGSDEEIPSDSEEEMPEQDINDVISDQSEDGKEESTVVRKRLKRKRKRPDWVSKFFLNSTIPLHHPTNCFCSLKVTISGKRDYEGYIARIHESLKSFRDSTIEKWSKRTKIASGKITSKVRSLVLFEPLEATVSVFIGLHASGPFSVVTNRACKFES